MMASDIHHRTEDFRNVYRSVLADLKEVMGTAHDVLMFALLGHRRHGRRRLQPVFPRRQSDRLRRREIRRALGGNRQSLWPGCRPSSRPRTARWSRRSACTRRSPQNPTRAACSCRLRKPPPARRTTCAPWREAIAKTDAILVVDAITGLGTMPLDIDGWGLDVVIGGSQKAFMIPPGPGVSVHQPEGLEVRRNRHAAALLFQSEEGKEERRCRRIELDAFHRADSGAGRSARIRQADRHGEADRERAIAGARHARGRQRRWAWSCSRRVRPAPRSPPSRRRRAWIPA